MVLGMTDHFDLQEHLPNSIEKGTMLSFSRFYLILAGLNLLLSRNILEMSQNEITVVIVLVFLLLFIFSQLSPLWLFNYFYFIFSHNH